MPNNGWDVQGKNLRAPEQAAHQKSLQWLQEMLQHAIPSKAKANQQLMKIARLRNSAAFSLSLLGAVVIVDIATASPKKA